MYTRQKRNQISIGYGGFGQIPQTTATVTVRGNQIKLTGPAHEVAAATAIASLINAAMGAIEQQKYTEAQAALRNAKAMLPSSGSLRSTLEPVIGPLETMVNISLRPVDDFGPSMPEYFPPTVTSSPNYLLYGGLGVAALLVIVLLLRR